MTLQNVEKLILILILAGKILLKRSGIVFEQTLLYFLNKLSFLQKQTYLLCLSG